MASNALTPGRPNDPLSSKLPPLIFGGTTLNNLYNKSVDELDPNGLVQHALELGIRAFDTSPYYGPSEALLGLALDTEWVRSNVPRDEIYVITKAGRIAANEFDYSASAIRHSVTRSLDRLRTPYLDLVYCHDVEFVSDDETLEAITELRRIRDEEGTIKYIGISGYPLHVLGRLAKRVLDETGEPLDAVLSYANFNLQNELLATRGIELLKAAGVDVVPNGSILGMGMLRKLGVPVGGQGDWHPAPPQLRAAVRQASAFCDRHGEKIEVIAIRYALESWITLGQSVGSMGDPASGIPWTHESNLKVGGKKLGVSIMGVSTKAELDKTLQVWRSILDGLEDGQETALKAGRWKRDHEWALNRKHAVQIMADGIKEHLADHLDFTWDSPSAEYIALKRGGAAEHQTCGGSGQDVLTPAQSPNVAGKEAQITDMSPLPVL